MVMYVVAHRVAVGDGERDEGFQATAEKSLESAASQISFIVGWDDGNKLCFIIFVSSVWRRCLLPSSSIPHQAELAYAILDTTVALVDIPKMGTTEPLGHECPDRI